MTVFGSSPLDMGLPDYIANPTMATAGNAVMDTGDLINTTGFDLLNPTAYPWSMSTGGSKSSGTTSSKSYTGLDNDIIGQLTKMVMPELGGSLQGFAGLPGTYSQNALNMYKTLMRMGLDKAMPSTLQDMMARGIIGGDVMSSAMANTAGQIIPNISLMGYQSGLDAADMAQNIPGILGQLMQLAQYTKSSSKGSTGSTSQNMSYSEDQSVPQGQLYNFLANLDLNMIPG